MKTRPTQVECGFTSAGNFAEERLPHCGQEAIESIDPAQISLYELLQKCLRTKKEELWTEFVRRSQPVIAAVIINRTRTCAGRIDTSVVDDLVQNTYLKLFDNHCRALREFDCHHENALYGFLKVVASSVVQDHFRAWLTRKRGGGMYPIRLDDVTPSGMDIKGHLERQVMLCEIDGLLASRSDDTTLQRDCTIFWLHYQYGLTCRAIAQIACVGLTIKGVESTIFRLTRHVRERYTAKRSQFS
jgi:RNA polymerase sigma-70 factor (ECF subfamily)